MQRTAHEFELPRSHGQRGRSRPLALLLTAAALGGGVVSSAVLAATGALRESAVKTTTVTTTSAGAAAPVAETSPSSSSSLDAGSLYASASPGVVDITARGVSSSSDRSVDPFGQGGPRTETATGTGFVYDTEGHIITAAHVVSGASQITVKLQDGTTRTAKVLGTDEATDVAVLEVDPRGLTLHPLELGSSASLKVGDAVAAIGDPFGYERSMSTGIVSGLDRTIQAPNGFEVAHAIQTDAALNPGNSGGPVLDGGGRVVGIVDQIATGGGSSEQSSGVGFAVPIDLVASELSKLEAGKRVEHAYLGIATSSTDTSDGATVASLVAGGPAAKAGLRAGDVITSIGGAKVQGSNQLIGAIASHSPGDTVTVTVRRGAHKLALTVRLGTQPTSVSTG